MSTHVVIASRFDAAVAYAVGLLLWFPPPPLPGRLCEGTGRPPEWWDADGAAERIRRRFGAVPTGGDG